MPYSFQHLSVLINYKIIYKIPHFRIHSSHRYWYYHITSSGLCSLPNVLAKQFMIKNESNMTNFSILSDGLINIVLYEVTGGWFYTKFFHKDFEVESLEWPIGCIVWVWKRGLLRFDQLSTTSKFNHSFACLDIIIGKIQMCLRHHLSHQMKYINI